MRNGDNDSEIESKEKFIADLKNYYRELLTKQGQNISSKDFSATLKEVARDLMATATIYRLNRADEVLVPRVSAITGQLAELSNYSTRHVERWLQRVTKLNAGTIEALLGGFPFASMAYTAAAVNGKTTAATISVGTSAWVPPDDRQARQDLKHLLNESPTGLVKPSISPSFVEMVCMMADRDALAGMTSDLIRHLRKMPDREDLIRQLVREWAPLLTDILARLFPAKLATLANEMEDQQDRASQVFLGFLEEEVSFLFRELSVKPGTVTVTSRLAAGIIEPILKAGDVAERQVGLRLMAERNPFGFKEALNSIVDRIEQQYHKAINPTGMGRRTTRSYVAPAAWVLINDVLDRIWLPENGSLTKATSALVCSIVELTHTHGELEFERFASDIDKFRATRNTGIGNIGINEKGASRERLFAIEHVKLAISYRRASYQLNCALEFLEPAICDAHCRLGVNHEESLRLVATIRVVHRWREEMDWRLLHGAYEKEQWRKSSMVIPRFPQMKVDEPIEERVAKIVAAAQPLINEMLVSMSSKSSATRWLHQWRITRAAL